MKLRRLYRRWPRLRRALRRRKDAVPYWLTRFGLWLPRQTSLERALRLADRVGDLAYRLLGGTRHLALENIERVLGGGLSAEAREAIVRSSFRNLARSFCEVAHFEAISARLDDYVDSEGWANWERIRAAGRGAIAVTGHIGNWELLAAYFARRAGVPVAAVARKVSDVRLNQLVVDIRARQGVETIVRESPSSGRQMLRVLKQGGILALLIDQDTSVPSVSVPFFGRPARTPAAAAALALRRDLPVFPVFLQRRPEGGHRVRVLPPIDPPGSGDRLQDIRSMTERCNQALEEQIRRNPAEWVWWHRRWRRQPVPRLDLDAPSD